MSTNITNTRLNPVYRVILNGVYGDNSNFSLLNGKPHIVKKIWLYVVNYWKENIKDYGDIYTNPYLETDPSASKGCIFLSEDIDFPKPTNININMMPFLNSIRKFSDTKLPKYCKPYWDIIRSTSEANSDGQLGEVWYLTIQESYVEKDKTQRRPGLHTDSPGVVYIRGNNVENSVYDFKEGAGSSGLIVTEFASWGIGCDFEYAQNGGIYIASNIDDSCMVYNCVIKQDKDGNEIIGKLGDVEHLREFLPEGHVMEKNTLYWITDRTPHESLPVKESCSRQFIRIVTSQVTLWYEDHSTKNPEGVVPNPKITKIVRGSKFEENSLHLVDSEKVSLSLFKKVFKT